MTDFPRIGDPSYGRVMKLKEKLQLLMARAGLNGQKLARLSQVSDSEISRILQGKSRPGLDNAFRLARAVGVSLDFLADDSLDLDAAAAPTDNLSADERKILAIAAKIGLNETVTLIETIRFMGYEAAMGRLVAGKPVVEIDRESSAPVVPAVASPRISSASA